MNQLDDAFFSSQLFRDFLSHFGMIAKNDLTRKLVAHFEGVFNDRRYFCHALPLSKFGDAVKTWHRFKRLFYEFGVVVKVTENFKLCLFEGFCRRYDFIYAYRLRYFARLGERVAADKHGVEQGAKAGRIFEPAHLQAEFIALAILRVLAAKRLKPAFGQRVFCRTKPRKAVGNVIRRPRTRQAQKAVGGYA